MPLNLLKRQLCGQAVEYAGFVFNTWRGLLLLQLEKREKLLASLQGLGAASEMSTRQLDGVKGRGSHYAVCLRHLRILTTELGRLIRTVKESAYDRPWPTTGEMRGLAAEMVAIVERCSEAGVPLWPPVASSAYAAFLRGELRLEFFALTWDASTHGWAALCWWEKECRGRVLLARLLVGTWSEGEDVS
jgi:hypothetical protein